MGRAHWGWHGAAESGWDGGRGDGMGQQERGQEGALRMGWGSRRGWWHGKEGIGQQGSGLVIGASEILLCPRCF